MNTQKTKHPGVYKRGDRYVAIISYVDIGGHRKQAWLSASTVRGAQDRRRAFLNDLDRGRRPADGKTTVRALFDEWLAEVEATKRGATHYNYTRMSRHILPVIGDLPLRDVGRDQLRALLASIPTAPLRAQVWRILSAAMNYAVRDRNLLANNPCASIRPPRVERKEARHLDVPDAMRLLDLSRGTELEPAIALGLLGGLRIGEVVAVAWGDVDLSTGRLVVRRSATGPTKSGKVRGLTLPAEAVASLRRCRVGQAERLLAVGVRPDDGTTVVADAFGRALSTDALRYLFNRFCSSNGFAIPFHGLRHTNAVIQLQAGVDVRTVAGRLGHADGTLVLTTYGHFVESADRSAASAVDAVLSR